MPADPHDDKPSPSPRIRVGVIGHVSRDKSTLFAALGLINRHVHTKKEAEARFEQSAVSPDGTESLTRGSLDVPLHDWEESRGHRPSWKALKEDARRSNRRGRRPR